MKAYAVVRDCHTGRTDCEFCHNVNNKIRLTQAIRFDEQEAKSIAYDWRTHNPTIEECDKTVVPTMNRQDVFDACAKVRDSVCSDQVTSNCYSKIVEVRGNKYKVEVKRL